MNHYLFIPQKAANAIDDLIILTNAKDRAEIISKALAVYDLVIQNKVRGGTAYIKTPEGQMKEIELPS